MRSRLSIVLGVVGAILAAAWVAPAAVATAPVALDSGFVTDDAGVLSAEELTAANQRLEELAESSDASLFVVFVDGFTNPADSVAWADDVAIQSNLGDDQYLIAIDVSAPQYGFSASSNGVLSDRQLDAIEDAFVPEMRAGDWPGVVTAAADAFPGPSPMGWILLAVVVVAAVVALIVLVTRAVRKKRRGAQPAVPDPNDPFSTVSDADLEQQAAAALIAADDALSASREELGFATAQFGDEATTAFTAAVDGAKAKLSEAFSLKQQLDDEIPDSAQQRRDWHIRIVQLCDDADEILDANADEFTTLRRLATEAPQALERVTLQRDQTRQKIADAPGALAALTQTYAPSALETVSENPAHAAERLALADREIADAETAIAENDTGEAAFAIRTAEQALAQAEQLTAAITALGDDLARVETSARELIAELQTDLDAASSLPDPSGQMAPVIAATRDQIAQAQAALQGTSRDPHRIVETLTAANTRIDALIAQVREGIARAQRNAQLLQQRLAQAQAQISAANDFISTRRGGIGATARTRLAESQSEFSQALALQSMDQAQALDRASRSYELARAAISAAQSDLASFGGGGGGWGGAYGGGQGGGLGGDILGGILGGLISGAARSSSRGGFGGGYSGRGASWGSGGGRGYRSSGFGGSMRGSSRGSSRSSSRGSSRGGR